jgi:hypothetical protein
MLKIISMLVVLLMPTALLAQSPADGEWDFIMTSPMGSVTAKVQMTVAGENLTGEFDLGGGRKWPIEEGKVQGNNISFKITRDGASVVYQMSAEVSGDEFNGNATAMGSTAGWSMKRRQ